MVYKPFDLDTNQAHSSRGPGPLQLFSAAKIFLKSTYQKLNEHGVGPPLLWVVKEWTENKKINSGIEVKGMPYSRPHGLEFSGFFKIPKMHI